MQIDYSYDGTDDVARAEPSLTARISSFGLMTFGVTGLLFAWLFNNLSPLSSGFVERHRIALIAGSACFVIGLSMKALINLRGGGSGGRARWIADATSVTEFTIETLSVPSGGTNFGDVLNDRLRAAARRNAEVSDYDEVRSVAVAGRRRRKREDARAPWQSPRFGPVERMLLAALAAAVAGWFVFAIVTYVLQDSLVFGSRGVSAARQARIADDYPDAEEIRIRVADDVVLHGWLLPAATRPQPGPVDRAETRADGFSGSGASLATVDDDRVPLIIVFPGQGGEASGYFELARRLPDSAWAFINYRGYGMSDGVPSDRALFADAVAVYDYFAARADIDVDNIFALGGSLGTGVAAYLAARRPVAGVVLFSPYDRIGGGVAQDLIPLLPTQILFNNRFDAVQHAPYALAPALAIIGEDDAVIRPERSRALMRRWGQPHRLVVVSGGDHYSVYESDHAWRAVAGFLRGLMK